MKVIDLLNKMANGEEVPKEIKWGTHTFELWENSYINHEETKKIGECSVYKSLEDYLSFSIIDLNDEVEVIEDTPKEDKKIDRIQSCGDNLYSEYIGSWLINKENYTEYDELLMNKINEIIDYINKE